MIALSAPARTTGWHAPAAGAIRSRYTLRKQERGLMAASYAAS